MSVPPRFAEGYQSVIDPPVRSLSTRLSRAEICVEVFSRSDSKVLRWSTMFMAVAVNAIDESNGQMYFE